MATIQHILFPYDFSRQADLAAPAVHALAERLNAKVTLYAVIPPPWDTPPEGMRPVAGDGPDEWKRSLQPRLDAALPGGFTGVELSRIVDYGDPVRRIGMFTEAHAVDLVMMPTRGQGLFRAMLIGSVTSKVLHDVRCPVWTAAHIDAPPAVTTVPRHILCAVDATDHAGAVCAYAAELAASLGATWRVMHAVLPVSDWAMLESERLLQESVRLSAETALASMLRANGFNVPLDVVVGDTGAAVAEHASWQKADLVVAGRGAINGALGHLRAHTFDIIQRSACPVISV